MVNGGCGTGGGARHENGKEETGMMAEGFQNMTMQQLEALIHLVEERSFSRAAKKMHLTQPSLTKHIRNVEEILGAKIVNRSSRGIALTPEGRVLYDYARRIVKLREEARDRVLRLREEEAGDIRIAASTIPATYILPYAIGGFRKKHPRIRTTVRTADSGDVIETVLRQRRRDRIHRKGADGGEVDCRGTLEGPPGAGRSLGAPLGEAAFGPCRRTFKGALRDPRERFGHPGSPRRVPAGRRTGPACRISTLRRSWEAPRP